MIDKRKLEPLRGKKDVKEVQRDLTLIRSPAAGLKRPAKDMEIEDDEDIEEEHTISDSNTKESIELDTSINLKAKGGKVKSSMKTKKKAKIIEEFESDQEMEAN